MSWRDIVAKEQFEKNKVECPKCKGKGCEHCDMKGYHSNLRGRRRGSRSAFTSKD
jgi:hypothetical protein